MLTNRALIPLIEPGKLNLIIAAFDSPSDVQIEYVDPAGGATVITTLSIAVDGTALHRVDNTHAAFSSGFGLIRLEAVPPNPGNFYAYLSAPGVAMPVSGTEFVGGAFRVPYIAVGAGGTQRVRVAISNAQAAVVGAVVTNVATGNQTQLTIQPNVTELWDSNAVGEAVTSSSSVQVVPAGGNIVVSSNVTRNGRAFIAHPTRFA